MHTLSWSLWPCPFLSSPSLASSKGPKCRFTATCRIKFLAFALCTMLGRASASAIGRRPRPLSRAAGPQGFQKKSAPKVSSKDKAEQATNRGRLAKEYEAIGKMARPTIIKPIRTAEEMEHAKQMTRMYQTEKLRMHNHWRRGEWQRIKLGDIARADLPPALYESCLIPYDVPFPDDFIWALNNPPLESQEVFGPFMAGEQFKPLDM